MTNCTTDDIDVESGLSLEFYDQPVCFKNRNNVTVDKSWMYDEYAFPVVILAYCRNSTENDNWCKTPD